MLDIILVVFFVYVYVILSFDVVVSKLFVFLDKIFQLRFFDLELFVYFLFVCEFVKNIISILFLEYFEVL